MLQHTQVSSCFKVIKTDTNLTDSFQRQAG